MRASAVSFVHKLVAAILAALLTFALVPFAHAEGTGDDDAETVASGSPDQSNDSTDSSGESQGVSAEQDAEGSLVAPMLASGLAGKPNSFVNSDVALDGEPVIGSFTVDGMTFAVTDESHVELVGVAPSVILSEGSEAAGPSVALSEAAEGGVVEGSNESFASEAGLANLALPETVSYEGTIYTLTSIAPYAFYLSGVADVTLPASVSDVDDQAFRSSDVSGVTVAEGNPTYSSFDGALYDADQLSLLLIPEGKQGTVRIPKTAEAVEASVFSHCPLADSISVDAGSAAFASENGLLYTSDLTTLLRVPAGATEITIREGCTTIAAGALEACMKLTTINAPATVTFISPDVFESVPTISLPVTSALADGSVGVDGEASRLTAMVALASNDDCRTLPKAASIAVLLADGADRDIWTLDAFSVWENTVLQEAATLSAISGFKICSDYDVTLTIAQRRSTSSGIKTDWEKKQKVAAGVPWTPPHSIDNYVAGPTTVAKATYICAYWDAGRTQWYDLYADAAGCTFKGLYFDKAMKREIPPGSVARYDSEIYWGWTPNEYAVALNPNGGSGGTVSVVATYASAMPSLGVVVPERKGYEFRGYWTDPVVEEEGTCYYSLGTDGLLQSEKEYDIARAATLYAHWRRVDFNLGFDVDSEPGDEDYKGESKDDQTVNAESGPTAIEDPKRPGYVFQGWTIPDAEGAEAVDQDLVYKGEDGKWYVDASKLPDYAGEDGRVELTARWTSVISVDVPSSVTFYADVVTQGNESREGLASSAFGQNKVQSQSEVDLRIVGLESKQVKGDGSTSLDASDILKKKDGSALPITSDKLFSLYPSTGELEEDDLKDPDATSASKPEGAVDFSLDDILLEKSFAAGEFTIPAGDTLSLGYRLNLQETSTELDYDKLSTLSEGASASIANISYCFAADYDSPADWGEPLWIENPDASAGAPRFLVLDDIKAAADDLSANGTSSAYYSMYKGMLDSQVTNNGNAGRGPYFQLKVGNAYIDLQLIGICQDTKSAGGKAGLTFQTKDIYAHNNVSSTAAGNSPFNSFMNPTNSNAGGWKASAMRERLRTEFMNRLDAAMQAAIAPVSKYHQLYKGETDAVTRTSLQATSDETIWLPSMYEVFGKPAVAADFAGFNPSEVAPIAGYVPFQYQAYQGNNGSSINTRPIKSYNGTALYWWLRSSDWDHSTNICSVYPHGLRLSNSTSSSNGLVPCFAL